MRVPPLHAHAQRSPLLITALHGPCSYRHLLESSERVSKAISRVVPQVPSPSAPPRIGLYAAPGAEYVAGTLAIWQAGGIVVPLATSHPQRELAYVLQDAGISAVSALSCLLAQKCMAPKPAVNRDRPFHHTSWRVLRNSSLASGQEAY